MFGLLVLGAAGLLFGLGDREIRVFEKHAAADIAANLQGTNKQVSVKVELGGFPTAFSGSLAKATILASNFEIEGLPLFTEPWRSTKGKIHLLQIRLKDFKVRGLQVEQLQADIPDCRYDFSLAIKEKKVRLSRSGIGTGSVRVSAQALSDFIELKYREITNVSVRLEKGKAFVSGRGDFGFIKTDFEVICNLEPQDGTKLNLANAVVFLDNKRVRDGSERALLRVINPVIDQNEDLHLYSALNMQKVTIGEGFLEVAGAAKVPEK